MIIGVDFDNTIVCYDTIFHKLALEKNLIPKTLGTGKNDVRDFLKKEGKEALWTELQGIGYGPRIFDAESFPGVKEFFEYCHTNNIKVYIISHKTRYPFIGEKHDLHDYALKWIEQNLFKKDSESHVTGLSRNDVFLELTKEDKMKRIEELKCDYFIDDLPEFLNHEKFPSSTKKVLFDSENKFVNEHTLKRVKSWKEFQEFIMISSFLNKNNIIENDEHFSIAPMEGGKNNKIFHVITAKQKSFLLKIYFKHPKDTRNRLHTESSFIKYAWDSGLRNISEQYAKDDVQNLALYRFIEGRKLTTEEINDETILKAVELVVNINKHKDSTVAKKLQNASESCFSIRDNIECVTKRLETLKAIEDTSKINHEAILFIKDVLVPEWNKILVELDKQLTNHQTNHTIDKNQEVPLNELVLSPSDFGFHNALYVEKEDVLYFIDFEYAGWDDAAKLVADFFSQPRIPVSLKYFDLFIQKAFDASVVESIAVRAKIILPIHRMKWCCIMLNEFLSVGTERRQFSDSSEKTTLNLDLEKRKQLKKAEDYLHNSFRELKQFED